MTSLHFAMFCVFFGPISCQINCIPETVDETKFSVNVTERIRVQSIDCVVIPHKVTFPPDKVAAPYKKMLFQGDPSNVVDKKVIYDAESNKEDSFSLKNLPCGEYDYGFKLEWGCNQTYTSPKRVHVSVLPIATKPTVFVPVLTEERSELICSVPQPCSQGFRVYWKWTKADGQSTVLSDYRYRKIYQWFLGYRDTLRINPTAHHHNTNITCVAEYDNDLTETTVTLNVKFKPKISNDSHCLVKGELLVCVCISWGNPVPPISWPLENLTAFSVTSLRIAQTVRSTFTMPASEYHNATVKCASSNERGLAETSIIIHNAEASVMEPNIVPGRRTGMDSALPWIAGLCFSLNLVFITALIVHICQRRSNKQKEQSEEMNTYMSLKKADVEEEYSVISAKSKRNLQV